MGARSAPDHLTPEIVHTTGGTEITVFGKFDLDDALCWFSDVTRPSVAFNITNETLVCTTPARTVGVCQVLFSTSCFQEKDGEFPTR